MTVKNKNYKKLLKTNLIDNQSKFVLNEFEELFTKNNSSVISNPLHLSVAFLEQEGDPHNVFETLNSTLIELCYVFTNEQSETTKISLINDFMALLDEYSVLDDETLTVGFLSGLLTNDSLSEKAVEIFANRIESAQTEI